MPLQVKALAISTALTSVVGAVALAGLKYGGLGAKDIADVASWKGAIQTGQYHKVRLEFPPGIIMSVVPDPYRCHERAIASSFAGLAMPGR